MLRTLKYLLSASDLPALYMKYKIMLPKKCVDIKADYVEKNNFFKF